MQSNTGIIAGIDLGTTNSLIAVEKKNRVDIAINNDGDRLTPSVVRLGRPRIFGKVARDYINESPKETVYAVKRLMGRKWNEPCVQALKNNVSFDIYNKGGYPVIRDPEGNEEYTPEQISAMILGSLKADVERHVGKPVNDVVITVPAAFNEFQRMATSQAAMIGGFNVKAVINEPTAAALQWLDENMMFGIKKLILVFDMGGGTTDITIVATTKDTIRVTSTTGDAQLGGDDIDNLLVEHFLKEIKEKHECDLSKNPRKMARLRNACVTIKHRLSTETKVKMTMDDFVKTNTIDLSMTRCQFEKIIKEIIEKVISIVRKVIKFDLNTCGSASNPVDITDIVLVGGSSRMPRVRRIFTESIGERECQIYQNLNCDEVVAAGAAIYASILSGSKTFSHLNVLDVAPLTYGIIVQGGNLVPIVTMGSHLPVSCKRNFTTAADFQNRVKVQIYEGTSEDKREIEELELHLTNLAKKGVPNIEVTFSLSQDFFLSVKAFEVDAKERKTVGVQRGNLYNSDLISRMRRAETNLQDADASEKTRQTRLNELEGIATKKELNDIVKWVECNQSATLGDIEAEFEKIKQI